MKGGDRDRQRRQRKYVSALRSLRTEYSEAITGLEDLGSSPDGNHRVRIQLNTVDLPRVDGGLDLDEHEDFVLVIPPDPRRQPATVEVEHDRWVGEPHVLQGRRICIYLDWQQEWDPTAGPVAVLDALWRWLEKAATGQHDSTTALYHAVGGVLHLTQGTPTLAVRDPVPDTSAIGRVWVRTRTDHRADLLWTEPADSPSLPGLLLVLDKPLPYAAGVTAGQLLATSFLAAGTPNFGDAVLTSVIATARRLSEEQPLYLVVLAGNATPYPHFIGARVRSEQASLLATIDRNATLSQAMTILEDIQLEWCRMSDERLEISTRRDRDRPTAHLHGRSVLIAGCGGLGSWIAELIARAGAARIGLADPGTITGGLLVRQNYSEDDIGRTKRHALRDRLQAIRDGLEVVVLPDEAETLDADFNLVLDATANRAFAVEFDRTDFGPATRVRVATDTATGTLGLVVVGAADDASTLTEIDQSVEQRVLGDPSLESFHTFWREPPDDIEIVPARGCSIPTFHGSAADMAALAGCMVSYVGQHFTTPASGTHLLALPHAPHRSAPAHAFLPHQPET